MFAKFGSNICLAIAALCFAGSSLSTVGYAGPVAVPACADTCCPAGSKTLDACSIGAGCTGCSTYKCSVGGGSSTCNNV